MDYAALAKQYGGSTAAPAVDYAALAKQFGGATAVPAAPKPSALSDLGAGVASLADTTIGGILPMVGQAVQPIVRPFTTPQRAEEIGNAVTSALDKPFGKAFGVTENSAYKNEASRQIMDFVGANVNKGADWISEKSGLPVEDVRNMLGNSMLMATPSTIKAAAPIVKNALAPVVEAVKQPLEARAARIQESNVAKSYQNATKIDAAQSANKLNIALNPAESNPTLPNKMKSIIGGTNDIDARLAKHNEVEITNRVREDLGVPMEKKLDAGAIDAALNEASAPYKVVREMPVLNPTDDIISTLDSLKKKPTAINKGRVEKVNALVDDVISEISEGKTGASVLDDIRQLRAEANSVYKQRDKGINPPKDIEIKEADARMAIANAYEQMIDANVTDPKLLDEIRAARVRMAQIYDHARALDYGTNTVDPMAYAKMLNERKGNMSGLGADIGAVAANYPNVVKQGANTADIKPKLTRSGIGGTLGFIVGGVPGAAAGAGAGYVASAAAAKRMMKPEYQKANAMPKDYRPAANTMSPQNKNALRGQ